MGEIICRFQSQTFRVYSNEMVLAMFDEIQHSLLHNFVRGGFGKGEYMLRGIMFLLVDSSAFHADRINKEIDERSRHLDFGTILVRLERRFHNCCRSRVHRGYEHFGDGFLGRLGMPSNAVEDLASFTKLLLKFWVIAYIVSPSSDNKIEHTFDGIDILCFNPP